MSKSNHTNLIKKVIVLEVNSVIIYLSCIIFLFIIGKIFIFPLKSILKIIGNSILGGILIFVINSIGTMFNFHIGLNVGTALITGILGIPRSNIASNIKIVFRINVELYLNFVYDNWNISEYCSIYIY